MSDKEQSAVNPIEENSALVNDLERDLTDPLPETDGSKWMLALLQPLSLQALSITLLRIENPYFQQDRETDLISAIARIKDLREQGLYMDRSRYLDLYESLIERRFDLTDVDSDKISIQSIESTLEKIASLEPNWKYGSRDVCGQFEFKYLKMYQSDNPPPIFVAMQKQKAIETGHDGITLSEGDAWVLSMLGKINEIRESKVALSPKK